MARMLLDWGSGAIEPGVTVGAVGMVGTVGLAWVVAKTLLAALSMILGFWERRRTGDQRHAERMALIGKARRGGLVDLTGPLAAVAPEAQEVTSSGGSLS